MLNIIETLTRDPLIEIIRRLNHTSRMALRGSCRFFKNFIPASKFDYDGIYILSYQRDGKCYIFNLYNRAKFYVDIHFEEGSEFVEKLFLLQPCRLYCLSSKKNLYSIPLALDRSGDKLKLTIQNRIATNINASVKVDQFKLCYSINSPSKRNNVIHIGYTPQKVFLLDSGSKPEVLADDFSLVNWTTATVQDHLMYLFNQRGCMRIYDFNNGQFMGPIHNYQVSISPSKHSDVVILGNQRSLLCLQEGEVIYIEDYTHHLKARKPYNLHTEITSMQKFDNFVVLSTHDNNLIVYDDQTGNNGDFAQRKEYSMNPSERFLGLNVSLDSSFIIKCKEEPKSNPFKTDVII